MLYKEVCFFGGTPESAFKGATILTQDKRFAFSEEPPSRVGPLPSTCSHLETAVYAIGVGPKTEVMFSSLECCLSILLR